MKSSRVACAAVLIAAVPLLVATAGAARAATATRYVATSGNDTDNDCTDAANPCQTIQHAVDEADAGDTVSVAAGSYAESVVIRTSLTISGSGTSTTTVTGDGSDPSIVIDGTDTNSLVEVTVTGLAASGNTVDDGIDVIAASVTLSSVAASDNAGNGVTNETEGLQADRQGAYGFAERGDVAAATRALTTSRAATAPLAAAAAAAGDLTITSSTISDNANEGVEVDTGSAHISDSVVDRNADGGVVVEDGAATIVDCTLNANTGAGVVADGSGTSATVTDSTISHTFEFTGNQQSLDPFGGAIIVFPGGAAGVSESTLYANTNYGVLDFGGSVQLSSSTVARTAAGSTTNFPTGGLAFNGGLPVRAPRSTGHAAAAPAPVGHLTVIGSIDADNAVPDCAADLTDSGYNLDSDGTCGFTAKGDHSHATADLGALANNGGPTETVLPKAGSPARNAIPLGAAGCTKTAKDQRHEPRPDSVSHRCDIGSVEAQVVNPKLTATVTAPHHQGGWYRGDVTVTFHCKIGTAALTHKCPSAVHLHKSGRRHLRRTIHALDGGAATLQQVVTVDNTKPHVTITGVTSGQTYTTPPSIHRVCHDSLSGIATCRLSTGPHGSAIHYLVVARDKAGNVERKRGTYFLAPNTGGLGCIARTTPPGRTGPSC